MAPSFRFTTAAVLGALLAVGWVAGHPRPCQSQTATDAINPADGAWRQLPPPSARYLHTAVHDPVRNRMIVFGGYSTRDLVNDVWAYSLDGTPEWTELIPAGDAPLARHLMSAIYDPVRDRIIVFGGVGRVGGVLNDVWALSLKGVPAWSRIFPAGPGPATRIGHSAVYDPAQDRMIVFGGYHTAHGGAGAGPLNDVWALSLSGPAAWTQLSPDGTAPAPRSKQSAVYDPVRHRILVFGGVDGRTRFNDVWSLVLTGKPRWRPIESGETLPEPRSEHAAIYDPSGDRMVVSSGLADASLSDTWSLSLRGRNTWTRLSASSDPPARSGHTAILDPVNTRMVVFGGTPGGSGLVNEVWALSLKSSIWTNLTDPPVAPRGRRGHSAVFDRSHDRMLLFGGYDQSFGCLNDVWALSLGTRPEWTLLRPTGSAPTPREGHSAIYDPVRDRVVIFGGQLNASEYSNEVWSLSLSGEPSWTQLTPEGTSPAPRNTHTAVYDEAHDRMIVYGGVNASAYLGDVWTLPLSPGSTWSQLYPDGIPPDPRFEQSAIYDPVRERMVVFGGLTMPFFFNDTWTLSLGGTPSWTKLAPQGTTPAVRAGHQAIYDPIRDQMVVVGGFNYSPGTPPGTETWALALDSPAWRLLKPAGVLAGARIRHSMIYDPLDDRLLVFGGHAVPNDVWELRWSEPSRVSRSEARIAHPALTVSPGAADPAPAASELVSPRISPNPSYGGVTISFVIGQPGNASVRIYDVSGRCVRTLVEGLLPAGSRTIRWDRRTSAGIDAQPGLYFCEVRTNGRTSVQRVALVR